MRRVSVFGSTGSIGCNTIDLLRRQGGAATYDVVALSGGRNVTLLAQQARELRADIAVTAYPDCLNLLRQALEGTDIRDSSFCLQEPDTVLLLWRTKDNPEKGIVDEARLKVAMTRRTGCLDKIIDLKKVGGWLVEIAAGPEPMG